MKILECYIGQKIKNWTILSEKYKKDGYNYVEVICNCGHKRSMLLYRVLDENQYFKCNACASKENNSKKKNNGYKSIGDLGGTYFNMIKKNAKARNIYFDLSREFLWNLFLKQKGKCALSGLDINLSRKLIKRTPCFSDISASLDRIDSSKGYIEDNVQWVHKWINTMKNVLSNNEFIFFCTKVHLFNKDNHEPSFEIKDLNISRKVQRLTGEESLSNNPDTSVRHPEMDDDIV